MAKQAEESAMVASMGGRTWPSYIGDDLHVEPNSYGSEGDWVTGHTGDYALRCEGEMNAPGQFVIWRLNNKVQTLAAGKALRIETLASAVVRWSSDGWRNSYDVKTRATTLGVQVVDLTTMELPRGRRIDFTFYWTDASRWEGVDFAVFVE